MRVCLCVYTHHHSIHATLYYSNIVQCAARWRHCTKIIPELVDIAAPVIPRTDTQLPKPIDNKPSHRVLPPSHWRLKQKICQLFHANNFYVQVRCRNSHIKTGKQSEFIIIIIFTMYIQQQTLSLYVQLLLLWSRSTHFSSRKHAHVIVKEEF